MSHLSGLFSSASRIRDEMPPNQIDTARDRPTPKQHDLNGWELTQISMQCLQHWLLLDGNCFSIFALKHLRSWSGWVKSSMMFPAFLMQREQWSSSEESRGQLVIFYFFLRCLYDHLERFPLCHCAAGEPHTDTVGRDSLFWAGHQQLLGGLLFFLRTLRKCHQLHCVCVFHDVDSQEAEVRHSLCTHSPPANQKNFLLGIFSSPQSCGPVSC